MTRAAARVNAKSSQRPRSQRADNPSPILTRDRYATMIEALGQAGYTFATFAQTRALLDAGRRFILLRHDVDFDVERALKLARIENARGITASYFFRVRTEHYNVFSSDASEIVTEILSLGHRLGLHFDRAAYPADLSAGELCGGCAREVALLQNWFSAPVDIVSYHRPDQSTLTDGLAISAPLSHVYAAPYTRDVTYLSDSRGAWRHGYPLEHPAFHERRSMQILTHPVWWTEAPASAEEKLLAFERRKSAELQRSIARNCTVYPTTKSH